MSQTVSDSSVIDNMSHLFNPKIHICLLDEVGNSKKLLLIKNEIIGLVIDLCEGHITQAAHQLRVGRTTLYRKVEKNRCSFDHVVDGDYIDAQKEARKKMRRGNSIQKLI